MTAAVRTGRAAEPVLSLREVGRRYGRRLALGPTSLEVRAGRIVGVVGPNGAGKSTLLLLALGVLAPTGGAVVLAERVARRRGAGVGAVLERDGLLPQLSAEATLRHWGPLVGVRDPGRIGEVLQDVGLDQAGDQRVATFSLGMRRRLALARALLGRPDLLVLDEPANGLDPRGVLALRQLLRRRADDGAAVILSSHSLADVDELCDEIVYLDRGEIRLRWREDAPSWWSCDIGDIGGASRERASAVLRDAGATVEFDDATERLLVRQDIALVEVLAGLRDAGVEVLSVADLGRDLHRPFRERTGWGR
ncbi:MAG: ATP-binding cassette domain-containing protein [Pseudonocardia sp.]